MSRRKKNAEHVNHERWLVSYADFITLLFAFFVVLFSSSQVDKRKVGKISLAMQDAFQQMGIFQTANSRAPMVSADPLPAENLQLIENGKGMSGRGKLASPFEMIRLFITHYQFPATRLSAAGYAEYHPVESNQTVEGRAQNRRVDIVVLTSAPEGSANPPLLISPRLNLPASSWRWNSSSRKHASSCAPSFGRDGLRLRHS